MRGRPSAALVSFVRACRLAMIREWGPLTSPHVTPSITPHAWSADTAIAETFLAMRFLFASEPCASEGTKAFKQK